jgi:Asp-tRNA(Asn)/Glu-tRNA(Gln) amidotransferase A subunit family amidase
MYDRADSSLLERAVRLTSDAQRLNALTWVEPEPFRIFDRTSRSAKRAPGPIEALEGVPVVVKDNIEVVDAPTTAGTPSLRDHIARDDAPVVRALKEAGAIVVAKTNLHELALGATSINPTFGTVLNPHDQGYTAGGSSGGSAVCVALGMVPLALGTDTSGSCRVPASCCGIVGFRPSLDRYPIDRVVPISLNRDTVGLLGRSVPHIMAADRVLAPNRRGGKAPERIRLGVPTRLAEEGVSHMVRQVFQDAVARIRNQGVEIVACDIPGVPDVLWPTQVAIISFDMPRHLATYLLRSGSELCVATLAERIGDPIVKRRVESMLADGSTEVHGQALGTMRRLRRDVAMVMQSKGLDALFYPTMVTTAPRLDEQSDIRVDGVLHQTGPTLLRNTLLATLAGLPSISLPIGRAGDGIPVGALLEGRPSADSDLLVLAAALEFSLAQQG